MQPVSYFLIKKIIIVFLNSHNMTSGCLALVGFRLSELPEKPDVIVVGSGPGGLSTAVLLSKAGKKVLVLEQHDQVGGTCHTFVDKGYEFDTGMYCTVAFESISIYVKPFYISQIEYNLACL